MAAWWNEEWLRQFEDEGPTPLPRSPRDRLTNKLYHDTLQGELQELLRYGDRNSMAFSRELRQPFLDHRLVEFVFALPPDHKLFRGETKVVMREAVRGLIPQSIVERQDKLGYQAPLARWLEGEMERWALEKLDNAVHSFSGRMTARPRERVRALERPISKLDSCAVFSILTAAESLCQLRAAPVRK
jgi:asparagine synthetase B (glutamine-hydrolysing)